MTLKGFDKVKLFKCVYHIHPLFLAVKLNFRLVYGLK